MFNSTTEELKKATWKKHTNIIIIIIIEYSVSSSIIISIHIYIYKPESKYNKNSSDRKVGREYPIHFYKIMNSTICVLSNSIIQLKQNKKKLEV